MRAVPGSSWVSKRRSLGHASILVVSSKSCFAYLDEEELCGRCFRSPFGIPFVPGAWPTLRPRIASWMSVELVNVVSPVEAEEYAHNASSIILMTACYDGSFTI